MSNLRPVSDSPPKRIHYYYVDEAGDLTLFDKKGRVMLGTPGVSNCFMIGVAHLPDPEQARIRLDALRAQLLADPYFDGVPSFRPEEKKTALAFHAKDDLPEVRREVFKILPELGAKIQVVVRRKEVLVKQGQELFRSGRKLREQDVYDSLVKRLFRDLLHKADENQIVFSHRGKTTRKDALEHSILKAKENFYLKTRLHYDKPTGVRSGIPSEHAGLQVVDYYLWALQRLYEAREDRFFRLLAKDYRLIVDIDDTRKKGYGVYYCDTNPLTVEKIKPSNRLGPSG
ncbi:MAG: DUF3800 domain-containing protein [Chloroflexi bacterium]|nr:DUF3800 domain-containing protein [Chloroflexota bacterium]